MVSYVVPEEVKMKSTSNNSWRTLLQAYFFSI